MMRKEWIGFISCLMLLLGAIFFTLWQSRNGFRHRYLNSENAMLQSATQKTAEEIAFKFLDRDIALFNLGLPEIITKRAELLEEIALQVLAFPKIQQVHAFELDGSSINLVTGTSKRKLAKSHITPSDGFHCQRFEGSHFSFFILVNFLEDQCIFEVQMEEQGILDEWKLFDRELVTFGLIIFSTVTVLLFGIFRYLSRRIREREKKLEEKNRLLISANQKLAQVYKTVSLGALTGHLMHSLKTPLTNLQVIANEANLKRDFDPSDLQAIHSQIRELVSQSLHSLQEIENQKKLYKLSLREIFDIVIDRTASLSKSGNLKISEGKILKEELDNLQSALLIPILISLVENAFQSKPNCEITFSADRENERTCILVKDNAEGIPPEEKNLLFKPSRSQKKGGTGLGLAIAGQLADCMPAELLLVESGPSGSSFLIRLNNLP